MQAASLQSRKKMAPIIWAIQGMRTWRSDIRSPFDEPLSQFANQTEILRRPRFDKNENRCLLPTLFDELLGIFQFVYYIRENRKIGIRDRALFEGSMYPFRFFQNLIRRISAQFFP